MDYFLGVPELRLPESEKYANDCMWFKKNMEYHLPSGGMTNYLTEAQEKMINISKLLVNQCQDQLKKNPIKITLKLSKISLEKVSFINKYYFNLKQYRDIFCYIIIKKCQLAMFQHPPRDLLAE